MSEKDTPVTDTPGTDTPGTGIPETGTSGASASAASTSTGTSEADARDAGAPETGTPDQGASTLTASTATEDELREALMDVVDPELGIDVVNLGLIYGIHIDATNVATVDMTLTSAACPLTDVIEDQAQAATEGIVDKLQINWVWMPPWGPDKITDDGREQLRALGFNV